MLEVLKESLADRLEDRENPNLSAFRYILVIDPTDVQQHNDERLKHSLTQASNTRQNAWMDTCW